MGLDVYIGKKYFGKVGSYGTVDEWIKNKSYPNPEIAMVEEIIKEACQESIETGKPLSFA